MNIQGKVWGNTSPLLITPSVEIHKINIKPYSHCSKHIHQYKWNGFYVISGKLIINVQKNNYDLIDKTELSSGEFTTVPPNELHWFETVDVPTVALEIYYPQHITDDIIRKTIGGTDINE